MNIQITGRNIDITDAIQGYINEKFVRLERHFDHISYAHITLSVEKKIHHIAKAVIILSGKEIVAHCEDKDMYQAIHTLLEKLDKQVIKYKEHATNH